MDSVRVERSLERTHLTRTLAGFNGKTTFEKTLSTLGCGEALIRVLASYIQFNSVFGSGVANLAGEIGARQDLFRDRSEPIEALRDRSVEIAARIICAAVDEFGDLGAGRPSHRVLAQATLKACADFFGIRFSSLNQIAPRNETTTKSIRAVCDGYGLNQKLDDCQLFKGIGFHIASETLADEEFRTLNDVLRLRHPELVAFLEQTRVVIDGRRCNGYVWIRVHTTVESEHRDAALVAAKLALKYYTGAESQACLWDWILEGARSFAAVQLDFIESLTRRHIPCDKAQA